MVALKNAVWRWRGQRDRIVSTSTMKPMSSMRSASSRITVWTRSSRSSPRRIRSSTRPGVPTTTGVAPLEGGDLAFHARAAVDGHRADVAEDADATNLLGHLHAQLAGRRQHQRLHVPGRRVDLLDDGNAEGGGLAGPGLRLPDQVAAGAQWTDGAGLHLRGLVEAHLLDGAGDGRRQLDLAEAVGLLRGQDGSQQRRVVGGCERFGRCRAVRGGRGAGR